MSDRGRIYFKTCPNCGHVWRTRDEFINDPDIVIIGYQVNWKVLEAGFFLFNHACGDTIGVGVNGFTDLYDGPVFEERATGTDACPEYCLHEKDLRHCHARCECAFVREIIQILKKRDFSQARGTGGDA